MSKLKSGLNSAPKADPNVHTSGFIWNLWLDGKDAIKSTVELMVPVSCKCLPIYCLLTLWVFAYVLQVLW